MANNYKQCFNTHYQPHCHPTTKSLWLCSSVYCGPPHQSRRIWLAAWTSDVESVSMLWCCHVCPLTRFRSTIVGWPCRVAPSHRHLRPRHHYQRRCRDTSCPPHWPAFVRPQSISDRGYLDCMHSRIHGGLEKHKGNNLGLHRANIEHCVQFTFSYLYLYRIPFFVEFQRSGGYFFNILF